MSPKEIQEQAEAQAAIYINGLRGEQFRGSVSKEVGFIDGYLSGFSSRDEEIRLLQERIKKLEEEKQGWISVDEQLPEPDINVLVCDVYPTGPSIDTAFYVGERQGHHVFNSWGWICASKDVSHWMPLPAPPLPS